MRINCDISPLEVYMRFSEIIGKKIVCLTFGKELGTIYSCTVDRKLRRIHHLSTVDNEENEGFVDNKRVFQGKDILYTLSSLAEFQSSGIDFPFRSPIYNTDGCYIGRAVDFEFNGNTINELYIGEDKKLKVDEVVLLSKEMIIVKGNRKLRIKRDKAVKPKELSSAFNQFELQPEISDESIKVPISYIDNTTASTPINITQKTPLKNNESPLKVISGYGFLLGRAVIKHIFDGGKLIIPKGKIIDEDTVEKARAHGKLVELTVSSIKERE